MLAFEAVERLWAVADNGVCWCFSEQDAGTISPTVVGTL
jgi:hypothetical protein